MVTYFIALNHFGRPTEYAWYQGNIYFNFGRGYYKLIKRPYSLLHHDMWKDCGNDIPPYHEIHHKDGNKRHNVIHNYELFSKSDHTRHHQKTSLGRRRTCSICGESFLSKGNRGPFYCKNCLPTYRKEYKKKWSEQHKEQIGKQTLAYYYSHKEQRICELCGAPFESYKHGPQRLCSRRCAQAVGAQMKRDRQPSCKIEGCQNTYYAKGYCGAHYKKARRDGLI